MKQSSLISRWFTGAVCGALLASAALLATPAAQAAEAGPPLDRFPASKLTDLGALQDGATTFVNYCLNCHSANVMRYNRLRDIGLSDEQIKSNLLFAADKVGAPMTISMRTQDAKEWFGAMPPDLSVITRARASGQGSGADWVYTYLRSFYRDAGRPTGWNNALFPNVGMPHVFWEVEGARGARIETVREETTDGKHGFVRATTTIDNRGVHTEKVEPVTGHPHAGSSIELTPAVGGKLTQAAYDEKIANLTAYLTYMSDPSAQTRFRMGIWVMFFLVVLSFFAWRLNREYWKDIR